MKTDYRETRLVVRLNMALMLLLWAVFVALPVDISSADLIGALAFALASALTVRAVPAVMGRALRPLPNDIAEAEARRLSGNRFNAAFLIGTVSAAFVPYYAAIVGVITDSPVTYVLPFVIGEVLLYRHVLPRPTTVAAARRRLEADGAASYFEEELTGRSGTPNASAS